MNLTELKNRIDFIVSKCYNPDDIQVGVKVTRLGNVGGTSITDVKSVQKGFDWDNNKLIIYTDLELREADRDELESLKKSLSDIGWTAYEFENLKRENKKLKKQLSELNGNQK